MTNERDLSPVERRVLGVLIEKELTTPDQYPLSLNALVNGCNQKSNRAPVMDLSESEVHQALERLRPRQLVGARHAAGSRVERYAHNVAGAMGLEPGEVAVLAELFLRGPQSPGDLRSRVKRMHPVASLGELETLLDGLFTKGMVLRFAPLPGSRSPRYGCFLDTSDPADSLSVTAKRPGGRSLPAVEADPPPSLPSGETRAAASDSRSEVSSSAAQEDEGLEKRLEGLEQQVAELRSALQGLASKLGEPLEFGR